MGSVHLTPKYLLDTHIALWFLARSPRLHSAQISALRSEADIFVSIVSLWEVSIKVAKGKLNIPDDFLDQFEGAGFRILPISVQNTQTIATLPHHHGDPFDRMLIAQAMDNQLTLMSQDRHVHLYDVSLA
jgi:PIN domain nuclease of toxin-antitoxin system